MLACNTKSWNLLNLHLCMSKNYSYTQHTSIVYFSLYLSSVVSDYLARDLARAFILAPPVTEHPVKNPKRYSKKICQKANSLYLSGKAHCMRVMFEENSDRTESVEVLSHSHIDQIVSYMRMGMHDRVAARKELVQAKSPHWFSRPGVSDPEVRDG